MRALARYLVVTGILLGLGWAAFAIDVDGRSIATHAQKRAAAWWAAHRARVAESPAKKAGEKKRMKRKARAKAAAKKKRPEREIPPTELQSEPGAKRRVTMLAEAAKRAKTAEKQLARPTRVTPEQKKALDALLTNRQSPD